MSGCVSCGAPTPNTKCRDCELAERFEAEDPSTFAETEDAKDPELRTDGGWLDGQSDEYREWIEAGAPEAMAAKRLSEDTDETCAYDCDNTADYQILLDSGTEFVCCQRCSDRNRIYAKENDLLDTDYAAAKAEYKNTATDGGTPGVTCDVDDCDTQVVGLDDGSELARGTVCDECIDYQDRHGHWPDEDVEICIECRIDEGAVRHECDELVADILLSPGDTCGGCGFEVPVTDGGETAGREKNYCTWGPATLYDLLEFDAEEIPTREPLTTEYQGLHLIRSRRFITVQPDGYAGALDSLDSSDYDDVLELVDDLNRLVSGWWELQQHGDREDRVEAAGRLMTRDAAKAHENEELYIHVPEDAAQRERGADE